MTIIELQDAALDLARHGRSVHDICHALDCHYLVAVAGWQRFQREKDDAERAKQAAHYRRALR
jgi:hypothetical protein